MEKSFVFNSVNGDRRYKAEDFREFFASFIGNGVFPNPSTNLQVIANSNMTITIKQGKAWINGAIYINTDDYIVPIVNADGVLNRIDRVVLRMDTAERKIYSYVKKGTFSSTPVAPTLQRDADAYELALADVKVDKGTISITQANITDLRQNKNYCGIVHGTVEQIDVTTLFNQYAAKLDEKEIEFEEEFKIWFETVKGQLSGDVAGNLAIQIEANKKKIEGVETNVKSQLEDVVNNLTANKISLQHINGMNATEVQAAIQELFHFANNGKQNWVDVIGTPLVSTDMFSTLKSKTQTLKNTFASNLNLKGISANNTETLGDLISKIPNIITPMFNSISCNYNEKLTVVSDLKLNLASIPKGWKNLIFIPRDTKSGEQLTTSMNIYAKNSYLINRLEISLNNVFTIRTWDADDYGLELICFCIIQTSNNTGMLYVIYKCIGKTKTFNVIKVSVPIGMKSDIIMSMFSNLKDTSIEINYDFCGTVYYN